MSVFAKLTSIIFFFGGLSLLLLDKSLFPNFYNLNYMAGASVASALSILGVGLVFKPRGEHHKTLALKNLQNYIALALILNALGAFGLYKLNLAGLGFDKVIHFLVPLILTIILVNFRKDWSGQGYLKSIRWAAAVVVIGSFGWEGFELISDTIFGSTTLGYYGQEIVKDTLIDILMDLLGILVASFEYLIRQES